MLVPFIFANELGPNTKTTRQTASKEIEIRISWIFLYPAELTKHIS